MLLTQATLLYKTQELRKGVIENAHRLPKAKQLANWLGQIETTLVEDFAKREAKEDPNQTKIDVDKDLASTGHSRTHQGNVGGTHGA